ncbi:VWA domain-containing protein [Micromonospora sp. NPDC048830]|uniref:VWA domain-containing protein n=1 Tax=Micromonospora sp. NPDC048830 TaxID=3364257 RepID=UPI0037163E1E
MTTGGVVRWGNRRWAVMALGVLVGPALAAPEPPGPPPPAAAPPAAEVGYRLGYRGEERPTLMLRPAAGGDPRPLLTTAERVDAEADVDARAGRLVWVGRRAAVGGADRGGGLYLRRPDAAPRRLVGGPGTVRHPALSPDGRQVAFTSDRAGNADVWIVAVDGSGLRRLTDHPAEDSWPTWSPDGRRIAFGSTRADPAGDVWTVPAAGGAPVRVTDGPAAEGQPAWSPDGRRLAFTTTRFAPPTDPTARTVATVAVAGGPVIRAVPGTRDAAEPAWSPDGTAIAFTSTRDDPAGDVYVARAGRLTPVAVGPLPEHGPAWRGGDLLWTATERAAATDVWTADATGGDRRDHTARPGLEETGPAFSRDGTRLAYSAGQPGGGARIVVADASGADPRTLAPPGTVDEDRDTDPAWSPTGDAIAFTRRPANGEDPSRILAVAVADGRLLAEIPMPAHLDGQDAEPSWSPDGTRIAFSRRASPRDSDLAVPIVDRPALPGGTFEVEQSVETPPIPPRPDIFFLVDDTSSMGKPAEPGGETVISQLKARLPDVIADVRKSQSQAQFGLATFSGRDGETGAYDPNMYRPRQQITADDAAMLRAVRALDAGSDFGEENWFYALRQIAAQDRVGFRPDSSRIVVLISDTNSRDKTAPDGTVIEESTLLASLRDTGIALIAVSIESTAGENGMKFDGVAERLAKETGGKFTEDSTATEMVGAIKKAIRDLMITVQPRPSCDEGLSVAFDPDADEVKAGTPAEFEEIVSVAPAAAPGSVLRCTIRFDLEPPDPEADATQELVVRVADPALPFVQVDDVEVAPTGPAGTRVTYQATAVDRTGRPLPVRCEPPSGSLFPIGQTVVTCTATDDAGRTGSDTALIVVADPRATGARIWLARLDAGAGGTLTVGDQTDLSARVGAGCPSRATDTSPAWSPDGSAIAFADSSAPSDLCVVAPDGSAARHPLAPEDRAGRSVADPAWSPDGRRIAVTLQGSEEPPDIAVLPSGGGRPTTVIRQVGAEPAFQRLPVPDLSLTVSVGNQPAYLGGDAVPVTFTVRNGGRLPADNVWLEVTAPDPLLPASGADPRCGASRRLCLLGTLGPGGQQVVTVTLPARAAVAAVVTGRLTATVREVSATRTARAPVQVLAPRVRLDPAIGPPGFVTAAVGAGFPPGARVRLRWSPGITATPDTVTAGADGTFRAQVLILRKDQLGPRDLTATRVTGRAFGPVRADEPFLVVPRGLAPPLLRGRG